MQIRHLERARLVHENGLDAQRLLPWPELDAPFEGSWCVIRAGTASNEHAHHEYEIFIGVRGEATLVSGSQQRPFRTGDVAYFPPGVAHRIVNDSAEDFEMYSVWWDQGMAHRFTGHDEGER